MKGINLLLVLVLAVILGILIFSIGASMLTTAQKALKEREAELDIFTRAMRLKMRGFSIEQLVMSDELAKVATLANFSDWTQASKLTDFNNNPNYYNLTYGGTYESLIEKCIVQSYMDGEPCLVAQDLKINLTKYHPRYTTLKSALFYVGKNRDKDVYVEKDGVKQLLCKRRENTGQDINALVIPYSESDDLFFRDFKNFQPYIHGGFMPPEFKANKPISYGNEPVIKYNLPAVILVSPFDIEKYPPQRVSLTIYVNDVDVSSGECKYNIYVFVQPQIGNSTNASTVRLFSYIRDITPDMLLWTESPTAIHSDIRLKFNLDESHTYYEIMAAVNAGLWEWNRMNFYDKKYIDAARGVYNINDDSGPCSSPIAVFWNMSTINNCGKIIDKNGNIERICSVAEISGDDPTLNSLKNAGPTDIEVYFQRLNIKKNELDTEECGNSLGYNIAIWG